MVPNRDMSLKVIKTLNKALWENRVFLPRVNKWLDNFSAQVIADVDIEREYALYLLSRLLYFGSREIRQMLKTCFHANVCRPLVSQILQQGGYSAYDANIPAMYWDRLQNVRFLGVGNPSESGPHLLYYFRQENKLPKELFIHSDQIFDRTGATPAFADPDVDWYIFMDDFCGSGQQVGDRLAKISREIKAVDAQKRVSYHMLLATSNGLTQVGNIPEIDDHAAVLELDDSFKVLDQTSRYLVDFLPQERLDFENLCRTYGGQLWAQYPVGYRDCQLAVSFHHNTPDNSLPMLWWNDPGSNWQPVIDRYPKFEFN